MKGDFGPRRIGDAKFFDGDEANGLRDGAMVREDAGFGVPNRGNLSGELKLMGLCIFASCGCTESFSTNWTVDLAIGGTAAPAFLARIGFPRAEDLEVCGAAFFNALFMGFISDGWEDTGSFLLTVALRVLVDICFDARRGSASY